MWGCGGGGYLDICNGSNEVVRTKLNKEVDTDVVLLVEENDLGLGLRVSAVTGSSIPVVAAHTTVQSPVQAKLVLKLSFAI